MINVIKPLFSEGNALIHYLIYNVVFNVNNQNIKIRMTDVTLYLYQQNQV